MNRDEVLALLQQVDRLRSRDLAHGELGTVAGFHDAAGAKDTIAEYYAALLSRTVDVGDAIEPSLLAFYIREMSRRVSELQSLANTIDEFAVKGVGAANFATQRTNYIDDYKARAHTAREQFQVFELYLRIAAVERALQSNEADTIRQEARVLFDELKRNTAESAKIVENVRDRVSAKGLQEARGTFAGLAADHAQREGRWFLGLVVSGTALLLAIGLILWHPMSVANVPTVAAEVFKRLLGVSALVVFLRIALAKYNAERNLRIVYAHRETVIAQFRVFESAIGESNPDAKNQLRLEIAKYIFTDPVTGYLSTDGAEININPVISTIEKAATRGAA